MIDCSARGSDDDVHPTPQCIELAANRLATVDRSDLHPRALAVGAHRIAHLDCELASGGEHENLNDGLVGGDYVLDRRQRKGSGFAGARCGLTQQVSAGEKVRNCLALDGGGFFVAERIERGNKLRAQPKIGKANLFFEGLALFAHGGTFKLGNIPL